jgi:hypothetical protein
VHWFHAVEDALLAGGAAAVEEGVADGDVEGESWGVG